MARGYPDFSGATAFPVRKHFQVQTCLVGLIPNLGMQAVFSLSGQAIIEGGWLLPGAIMDLSGVWLRVQIDGQTIDFTRLLDLSLYGIGGENNHPLVCSYYDPDAFQGTVQMRNNYYCGYEYIVYMRNLTGDDLSPLGQIWYSDVT